MKSMTEFGRHSSLSSQWGQRTVEVRPFGNGIVCAVGMFPHGAKQALGAARNPTEIFVYGELIQYGPDLVQLLLGHGGTGWGAGRQKHLQFRLEVRNGNFQFP